MLDDISKYLKKFSKNIEDNEGNKSKIIEIIKQNTGVEVFKENIEIKNNVLYVKISPAGRNTIFINKRSILEGIKAYTQLAILDIK